MIPTHQRYRLFMFVLFFLALAVTAHAADVTLSWDDPNNDPSVVAGYDLYYWESGVPSVKVDVRLQTSYTVTGLTDGHTYSFAVTAYDTKGNESSQSTVISQTVGITNSNTPPVANNGTLTVQENVTANGVLSGSDADGDALTYKLGTAPRLGAVTITDASSGAYTYTPVPDTSGSDAFSFYVDDGQATSSAATVTVTIVAVAVNSAPVAQNGTLSTSEDVAATGKLSASDADGDPLTFKLTSNGSKGTVSITNSSTGAYTYTPKSNMNGTDSFTFTAYDGAVTSNMATVTVTIAAVNDAPVAANDSAQTNEDQGVNIAVLANDSDPDGDALVLSSVTQGANGAVAKSGSGVTYTPKSNFHGNDSFTYTISDGHGGSAKATVAVSVASVNDTPVAANDSAQTNEDQGVSIAVLANDSDPDGDALAVSSVTQGANGAVAKSGSGVTYTPKSNFHGNDSFTYTISDGHGGSAKATVAVSVASVNDVPVAQNGSLSIDPNSEGGGTLLASDVDGDALTYRLVTTGSQGTATLVDASNGTYTYKSNADATGTDTFSFAASDGTSESNVATVTVEIKAVSKPMVMEVGEVIVDDTWLPVPLSKSFTEPVVVATSLGHDDVTPAVVRIRNVTPTGFEIRLQVWGSPDGAHAAESVGYMVLEGGHFTLPDGTQAEAGYINMSAADAFAAVGFQQSFDAAPVVLTAITSVNEADAVTTRVQNVTMQGFEARMQEQESNTQAHATEQMAYLAWTPSSGTLDGMAYEVARTPEVVTQAFYTVQYDTTFVNLPVFIGAMQTTNGTDTANVRWENDDFFGVDIQIAEEQSADTEIDHAAEAVGYMVVASTDTSLNADADGDGLSNVAELETYGTDPAVADTDQDGIPDGAEVLFWNTSYHDGAWNDDVDGDGIPNLLDLDSDDDGILDGDEIKQGSDPADRFSPNAPASISLTANGRRSRGSKKVDLGWRGATGRQVRVFRMRNGVRDATFDVNNNDAYQDSVGKGGNYSYQVCETDLSVCSAEVAANL